MVGVMIGSKPLAGFDRPIDLLKDCHRRIEHFLDVLRIVVKRFGDGDLPEEGQRALDASLDYFAHAAPRHTADEEQSLFPRLRRSEDAEASAVMAELERLEFDHRRTEACHAEVEELGRRWLQTGRIDAPSRTRLHALLEELAAIYSAHIRLEEKGVFVISERMLAPSELSALGSEMRQRRIEQVQLPE